MGGGKMEKSPAPFPDLRNDRRMEKSPDKRPPLPIPTVRAPPPIFKYGKGKKAPYMLLHIRCFSNLCTERHSFQPMVSLSAFYQCIFLTNRVIPAAPLTARSNIHKTMLTESAVPDGCPGVCAEFAGVIARSVYARNSCPSSEL